ncbi:MAG: GGDEF domain-containing protein [Terracidiphilus sp.]
MFNLPQELPVSEPDSEIGYKLAEAERVILFAAALVVLASIAGWLIRAVDPDILPGWNPMNLQAMLLATLSGISLAFSHFRYSRARRLTSILLAGLVTILSLAVIFEYAFHVSFGIDTVAAPGQSDSHLLWSRMAMQSALGFGAFGIAQMFATVRSHAFVLLADFLTLIQAAVVLTVVTGHFIAILHVFASQTPVPTSAQTMICMLLLSAESTMRRTERGVLNIFVGEGSGSKVARILAPVLLLLPYLREALRAHFISENRMPAYYTTAMLATIVVIISSAILIYLARQMNVMEAEVNNLSLRDGLTDLYNLRGFQLLSEQALRLARRLKTPFSMLFIDLDDLKKTNDTLGHQAGSDLLIEVAEILKSSFRETDVLARIGGDEFAIAGQFSEEHIAQAAHQLEVSAEVANRGRTHPPLLSFSVGCVTMPAGGPETLDSLLARADQAMYDAKRRKKTLVARS